ncbi:hypothetical protein AAG747_08580 [Rapidithrix thailandica]|uniref:Phosphoribosylanthranilate isomerase n=1 Tax=Rapidithrix thailandica TaxID=413964 RepID=A0AAW9RSR3_9BACT
MALRTRVKVSGVSNLHNGRYCAGMGVEMMGIPVDPVHPQYVNPEDFQEIMGWLSGIQAVGEISSEETPDLSGFQLDYIEISQEAQLASVASSDTPIIYKVPVEQFDNIQGLRTHLSLYHTQVAFFILDFGAQQNFDQAAIAQLCQQFRIFLAYRFDLQNLNPILDTVNPEGIVLQSSEEIKVGYNNFDELADLLESIELED